LIIPVDNQLSFREICRRQAHPIFVSLQFAPMKTFSLKYVTETLQNKIELQFPSAFWVKAEINKLGFNTFSKHAYPELVEKEHGKIVAQMNSTLFARTFQSINEKFLQVLNEPLKDGITALLQVKIQYSPLYGLSLNILDIDPSYTLGELEKERLESIKKLKEEGLFYLNQRLPLPKLLQRLAVISGEGTQGCSDFLNVLTHNEFRYQFHVRIFSALMQGDAAVNSIIQQFQQIKKQIHEFDAVVIIRGGGGNVGMTCYNKFDLSREIATFPLPVFTGIGHSTNEFVADLVAHKSSITPTGIATFLVNFLRQTDESLQELRTILSGEVLERLRSESSAMAQFQIQLKSIASQFIARRKDDQSKSRERINHRVRLYLQEARWNQKRITQDLKFKSQYIIVQQAPRLAAMKSQMKHTIAHLLQGRNSQLHTMAESVKLLDPQWLLNRGYSITFDASGKILKNPEQSKPGEEIRTQLAEGILISIVKGEADKMKNKRNKPKG